VFNSIKFVLAVKLQLGVDAFFFVSDYFIVVLFGLAPSAFELFNDFFYCSFSFFKRFVNKLALCDLSITPFFAPL
jgi:hypothetical protein